MVESNRATKQSLVIAMDGPVASGKGTIAPLLAMRLKAVYLPTGTMYRCVAFYALEHNLLANTDGLVRALPQVRIRLDGESVFLNDVDVTENLKENRVSQKTPMIAILPEVRHKLIEMQQKIGKDSLERGISVVAEGRDIGTVVFPDAKIKIYLTASPAVRARRRLEQLHAKGDTETNYADVFQDTIKRDTYDQEEVKTLVKKPEEEGYKVIDNSELTQEETLDVIERYLLKEGVTL